MRLDLVVAAAQQPQAEDDSIEEVADVVGDHAQEIVTVRDGVIRTVAFGEEIRVRGRPLVHEQGGQGVRVFLADTVESHVRGGAFHPDDVIGLGPFVHEGLRFRRRRRRKRRLVRLQARVAQNGIRDLPRLVDHLVGIALGGSHVVLEDAVGIQALGAKAVVRLRALRQGGGRLPRRRAGSLATTRRAGLLARTSTRQALWH
jgi:hypothetical protein